jgi:spore maturation protein CgeB
LYEKTHKNTKPVSGKGQEIATAKSSLKTRIRVLMMEGPEQLSRFLRERRRNGPPRRIFFMRQGFFLEEECLRAFRNLGFTVQEFKVPVSWDSALAPRLLTGLVEFLPDFLFCINRIGFDKSGWLTGLLKDAHLPAATWYVDNPDFIIRAYPENVSEWVAVFVWDQHYVENLKGMGFSSVTYLPLAADTRLFRPYRHPPLDRFCSYGAAFVGDTWAQRVSQQLARYARQPATLAYIEAAAQSFQWSDHYQAKADLSETFPEFAELPVSEQVDLEAAVLWQASLWDRLERAGALAQAGLKVFGDAAWAEFLPDPTAYGGPISYHRELPAFYQCVAVNLNFTSLQMKNGLNQRVFDVPAAGAFLLTDYKETLWELFSPEEMVTFRNIEEAQEKLAYYLKYPGARRQIATGARERVLSQHTYGHRLQVVERQLTETFFR